VLRRYSISQKLVYECWSYQLFDGRTGSLLLRFNRVLLHRCSVISSRSTLADMVLKSRGRYNTYSTIPVITLNISTLYYSLAREIYRKYLFIISS
jgi:hypothetical protein